MGKKIQVGFKIQNPVNQVNDDLFSGLWTTPPKQMVVGTQLLRGCEAINEKFQAIVVSGAMHCEGV